MELNPEQTVYQFYTIDDPNSLILENQDLQENFYEVGEDDGQDNHVVYVTLRQDEEEEEEEENTSDNLIKSEESLPQSVSSIKLVTLENGQVYLTTENSQDDNLTAVQPHLLTNGTDDEASSMENFQLDPEEVHTEENTDGNSDFLEIQLKDGTCAIIDAALWNSLVENTPTEEPEINKKKKFSCMYIGCNKSFTTTHHLSVHIRSHTGNRPYTCTIEGCDKAFATGYSLKAHLRTHTGEKPYGCNVCLKRFKTSGDLQKHVRTHTGEKPFKCPIEGCDKSFTTSNIRKVHIRSHTGERPYTCQVTDCGKAFASATNYKNHMRIHSGEKPYLCHVEGCGKRFTEYSSLYKHSAVHQPYRNFRCDYCSQHFKFENTLKLHRKTVHSVIMYNEFVVAEDEPKSFVVELSNLADLKTATDPLLLLPENANEDDKDNL